MTDLAIDAERVSKRFWLHRERRTGLKERFVRGRPPRAEEFWALRDATFSIARGSTFGLLGQNGSGKSTTLKVLAGIYRPTSGRVTVNGRVSALLELGAGFHGDLTGRENIRLNGAILGLSGRQIEAAMDGIIDFAGIGEFIDSPVKIYSSGMFVRLGFAVAVSLDPEILMVDEVIAVGDEEFQRKCFDHLYELRKRGTTVVLVTHSLGLIRDLCDEAAWLDNGRIRELGPARDVADSYLASVNDREVHAAMADTGPPADGRTARLGSGEVRITSLEYLDADGMPTPVLLAGAPCTVRMHFEAHGPVSRAVFGLGFLHESGSNVAGPNSGRVGPFSLAPGRGYVDFTMEELLLQQGSFQVSTAIVERGHTYDFADRAFDLHVRGQGSDEPGLTRMPGTWKGPIMESGASRRDPPASRVIHAEP
jgi:ABC-2 type transport system ATP-binding protein/lipopolysaccharide transport system ATP-binding protein